MSQEKVNRYKKEKANRKAILKREKRKRIFIRIGGTVVCLAIVGWIGYSAYSHFTKSAEPTQTEIDLTATQDYMASLEKDEAKEDTDDGSKSADNGGEESGSENGGAE